MKCNGYVNDTRDIIGVLYGLCENEATHNVENEGRCDVYCDEHI